MINGVTSSFRGAVMETRHKTSNDFGTGPLKVITDKCPNRYCLHPYDSSENPGVAYFLSG